MKSKYWMIIWGGNARMSWKCKDKKTGALNAYGCYHSCMKCIDLGTRKTEAIKTFNYIIKGRKLTAH